MVVKITVIQQNFFSNYRIMLSRPLIWSTSVTETRHICTFVDKLISRIILKLQRASKLADNYHIRLFLPIYNSVKLVRFSGHSEFSHSVI